MKTPHHNRPFFRNKSAAPRAAVILACCTALFGCEVSLKNTLQELTPAAAASNDVKQIEAALNVTGASAAAAAQIPTISGMGYAVISSQPSKNVNQKRLMAIRAARLEATRDLTEQIHGLKVNSRTTMIDAIIQNDTLRATVEGTIRGARTVRINPVGSDTYEVVLELDRDMIAHIMKAARAK